MPATVQGVLDQEALKNEKKFATVRALVLLASTILDVLVFCFPQTLIGQPSVSPTVAMIGLTATGCSVGIVALLRRPVALVWLSKLQLLLPLFDGLLLLVFIGNIWRVFGEDQPLILTNVVALCALLAVSGGMRFRALASLVTTAIAALAFLYGAYLFQVTFTIALFTFFTILGIGFLSLMIGDIVRHQIRGEAGRFLMERFLPPEVVNTAFNQPQDLFREPLICDVTVMITDLRGFTHYSEKLEPAAVLAFLSQVQGLLSEIVEAHGGWVNKFMGDGMLAVFGAPTPLDNHAEIALAAAQVMLQKLPQISPLAMGIGLHSGPVVAGYLGDGHHVEFTVIGDTVNVASRIEALTKEVGPGLLISATTYGQIHLPMISVGYWPLRGRDQSLELFTLPPEALRLDLPRH
ncbi:adenylate/guanylate cyclase domain-containing protein [Leptolyngbya sp. PCC 6406]|uniref:adenylate/guanylate cyclase domain-containing protein n=1 Tax=Leptolyngbya sp. PCC 6406 TaxID=1173264 RepID=UPI001CECDE74|nr:adenylate/guanylate cyclase domain-containing protein [Leptolyngbya sp. PCC 6406]